MGDGPRSESRQVLNGEQLVEPVYLREALAVTSPQPKGNGGKQTGFGTVRLGDPGNIWNVPISRHYRAGGSARQKSLQILSEFLYRRQVTRET